MGRVSIWQTEKGFLYNLSLKVNMVLLFIYIHQTVKPHSLGDRPPITSASAKISLCFIILLSYGCHTSILKRKKAYKGEECSKLYTFSDIQNL